MPFAVCKYQDTYREKAMPNVESVNGRWERDRFQWFDAEQEAKDFIIRRARIKAENAAAELRRARKQLLKVAKKFGTPCEHGFYDPEECGFCDDLKRLDAAGERSK